MTQVNSPFLLGKIRPVNELSKQQNNYLLQLERILQQLYRRSGGTSDYVDDTDGLIDSVFSDSLKVMSEVGELTKDIENRYDFSHVHHKKNVSYKTTGSNYTAVTNQFVTVTASCTITLPSTPSHGSEIWVQPTVSELVTISGSVNGESSIIMHNAYDLMHLRYDVNTDEWSIV